MEGFFRNYGKSIVTAFLVVAVLAIGTSPAEIIDLGTAADFAVLGGSGVTNTGTSTFTGDVGSWPTPAITGITAEMVNGILYLAADPATDAAHTDLQAAYTAAQTAAGGVAGPADLGGTTLTPGVYVYAAAAPWTAGNLTLDALGDSSAQWIFQIGSTLITPEGAMVSLVNGASAGNVFWQVGSSATIGGTNAFVGNILAQASISLGGGTLNGRALAIDGAVTISAAETIIIPEPATMSILGFGMLSLIRRKK
ncbi:MAG: DUF3494 domain-containing protein [Planctomycetaceae bacterium]|nr:DUF3494 domain-containing protein [Planctomycetaceae bacterium]